MSIEDLRFYGLFKEKALEVLRDLKNYTSDRHCCICKKEIENLGRMDHFNIWSSDGVEAYVTFHFKCAIRREELRGLDSGIMNKISYKFP